MPSLDSYLETCKVSDAAAQEILAAYNAIEEPHWNGNSPVRHEVHSQSLVDQPYSDTLSHQVSYGEAVKLRKGHGIIARILRDAGVCTGDVAVQPACDDFDL